MDSWDDSTPRILRKDFDGEEKVYRFLSTAFNRFEKEHWSIYCVCALRVSPTYTGPPLEIAVRNAWKALRFEYPGLSVVPEGFTKVYVVPDALVVEAWASNTFAVESTLSADEIIASFTPRDLPSLYYLPSTSEILFRSSHWRIDAVGTCMLLDRLFAIIAQPPDLNSVLWAKEFQNMSPSMEDAVAPAEKATPEMEDFARKYIDNFHKNTLQNCGLPYNGDQTTPPGKTTRQAVIFTKESTAELIRVCKAKNISITAAIHAALAETVFALSLEDQHSDYTTVLSINLRKYLQPPYRTKAHACQTYVTSITPRVLRNSNFSGRATALVGDYNNWHSQQFMKSLRLIYKYHSDAVLARQSQAPPPSGVFLSSLGVVEQYLTGDYGNDIHVGGFRFGVTIMTRQMLLYPWTFRGRFNLSVNYNEAYYDSITAREVLDRVRHVLETELELKLDCEVC